MQMSNNNIKILHYGDVICYGCKEIINSNEFIHCEIITNKNFHYRCKNGNCVTSIKCKFCFYIKPSYTKSSNDYISQRNYNLCSYCGKTFCFDCSGILYDNECKDCENM